MDGAPRAGPLTCSRENALVPGPQGRSPARGPGGEGTLKILVGGISHESNTFSNLLTGMRQFEASRIAYGDDIPKMFEGTNTSAGGFLSATKDLGIEPKFTVVAGANPSGPVLGQTYEHFKERILDGLNGERVDGVYLAL